MLIAGVGCRPDCEAAEIAALVRRAGDLAPNPIGVIAAPHFRADHAELLAAARQLGLELRLIDRPALLAAQPRCATLSHRAAQEVGIAAVAEGAALAASGPGGRLVLPRIASANATCALAMGTPALAVATP